MTAAAIRAGRPRWLVPEVVQTSAMDCGPAALKCILEGFRIPVSYGRLREACQTSVDGTSIDAIEAVANQLGIAAEQVMLPADHLFRGRLNVLPALVVVRQASGDTHFVVVWRRVRNWLQVMDPAVGRRWIRIEQLLEEAHRHELSVPAAQWRQWAASADFVLPLSAQLTALGASRREIWAQFLMEAAIVGVSGGIVGVVFTGIGVLGIGLVFEPDIARLAHVDAGLVGLTLVCALVATLGAAFYPTWRAARVQPAWQLKYN